MRPKAMRRKWDLHVHTPCSALEHQFGPDFTTYAKEFFQRAVENQIATVGVTDYFSIDGYKELRQVQADGQLLEKLLGPETALAASQILLLPNVELRSTVIVDGNRVNFHVIFSDTLEPKVIEEHFFRQLQFTSICAAGKPDERWALTIENLKEVGGLLKKQHVTFGRYSDLCVGMMNATVSHEDVTAVLGGQASRFEGKYLIVVAADEDLSRCSWDGQAHLARKLFLQKAHMLFSSNAGTREFALGKRHGSIQSFEEEFGRPKPCIHGSDAHSLETLFLPADGRQLWIKSDPTFVGLQQLLHEPDGRVFIGPEPEALRHTRQNATRYICRLEFTPIGEAKLGQKWFSGQVDLNHGLVVVIGNKGSGKSAFVDIVGLLGESRAETDFSFLSPERFLRPKDGLGSRFSARMIWLSGLSSEKLLGDRVDHGKPELIKYLPQASLESICSELQRLPEGRFYEELMAVIFSHVQEADRLRKETLPDLIDYIVREQEEAVSRLEHSIHDLNGRIVVLEAQGAESYRRSLVERLKQKEAELKAHDAAKPAEVKVPEADPEERAAQETVRQRLGELVQETQILDRNIETLKAEEKQVALKVAAAERLETRVENLQAQIERFHLESAGDAEILGIDSRGLLNVTVASEGLAVAKRLAEERRRQIERQIDPSLPDSLPHKRGMIASETEAVRSRLDQPNRRYQEYLRQLSRWQGLRKVLIGTAAETESVEGLSPHLSPELKQGLLFVV